MCKCIYTKTQGGPWEADGLKLAMMDRQPQWGEPSGIEFMCRCVSVFNLVWNRVLVSMASYFCCLYFVRSISIMEFMCEFGNCSRRQAPEWKKICVWVKHWCKTASVQDWKKPGTQRLVTILQDLLHASDVLKLFTLLWFCKIRVLTLNTSWEDVVRILHRDLTFQPYKLQIVYQLIQYNEDGWMRAIFFQLVLSIHKISGNGTTQIQENYMNDYITVGKLSDVMLGQLV